MALTLGASFPNFEVESTHGTFKWHDFQGDSWGMLCSHPADFTPVCTTEISRMVELEPEFTKRNVKMAILSIDSVADHNKWTQDIVAYGKHSCGDKLPFPILADPKRELAIRLGMLDAAEKDAKGLPLTCRAVFIVGPDKTLKLSILYPATTGRNFHEVLRVIDSLQLTATKKLATPVEWNAGDNAIVVPSVKKEELTTLFPKGVETTALPSGKEYLRWTAP